MARWAGCLPTTVLCLVLSGAGAPVVDDTSEVRIARDVVYGRSHLDTGETIDRVMTVYLPPAPGTTNHAAVIHLHGNPGDSPYPNGRQRSDAYGMSLARRGYGVFVVAWDLRQGHLAAFVQTKTAVRHVRVNAESYGIDPNRIAVHGSSYGGSWAIALASTDEDFGVPNEEEKNDPVNNWGVSARVRAAIATPGGTFWDDELDENDAPILYLRGTLDPNWYDEPNGHVLVMREYNAPYAWFPVDNVGHGIPLAAAVAFGRSFEEILSQYLAAVLLEERNAGMALLHAVHDGPGHIDLDPVNGLYPKGQRVTLTAKPNDGAVFVRWEGAAKGESPEIELTMDENKKVRAVFQEVTQPADDPHSQADLE
jgi:dienelactone hydrolase